MQQECLFSVTEHEIVYDRALKYVVVQSKTDRVDYDRFFFFLLVLCHVSCHNCSVLKSTTFSFLLFFLLPP